jgi:hypothetical protein
MKREKFIYGCIQIYKFIISGLLLVLRGGLNVYMIYLYSFEIMDLHANNYEVGRVLREVTVEIDFVNETF